MRNYKIILSLLCLASTLYVQADTTPKNDPSFRVRAQELVSKMTLQEKISQTLERSPAIERLGIKKYNWWNEILHGVART
ncbi:MAG: glycosyl hydrolase, partial [Rikenellaceae bacterium]